MEQVYLNVDIQQIHFCIVCWKYQGFVEIALMVEGYCCFRARDSPCFPPIHLRLEKTHLN